MRVQHPEGMPRFRGGHAGEILGSELERARQYRDQAAELLRLSERIAEADQRRTLVDLASTYHRMAEQIEEIYRLDIRPLGHT
jgi:hypothetical protein